MSEEKDWAATPDAVDPGEATRALDAEESSPDRLRPSGAGSTHHDFGDYDLGGGRMVSDQYRAIPTPSAEPTSFNTERDRAGQIALLVEDVEHRRAIAEEAHALMDAADIPQMGLVTRVTALVDEVQRLRLVVSGRPGAEPWPAAEAEARLVSAVADLVTQANANTSEPAQLDFVHTPEERPATTKRTFTVVRMWRVEADTVMQALDAAPRDAHPDEVHVHRGVPEWTWLRGDRS